MSEDGERAGENSGTGNVICVCSEPGFCSARNCEVNKLLWKKCQRGHYDIVSSMVSAVPIPKKEKPKKAVPIQDGLGNQIKLAWEKEIKYEIKCQVCIDFLSSLNGSTEPLENLLNALFANLPTPDWWRSGRSRKERVDRIREVLSPLFSVGIPYVQPISTVPNSDWTVVVTTSPRQSPTIQETLESLRANYWEPTVFAEPESTIVDGYRFIHNPTRLGAWHNWLQSVRWALNTNAKYILTVQDDSLFHPDSRTLVETTMWPSARTGFISLYTAKQYSENNDATMKPKGINRIITTSLWGACALVFPRNVLEQIIEHPVAINWTGVPPRHVSEKERQDLLEQKRLYPYLIQNIDTAIGMILNSLHLEMFCIDPSPVMHISKFSSIGHSNSNAGRRNCIRCADHSKPLKPQVFP